MTTVYSTLKGLFMFAVHRSMKNRSIYVYSTQKAFSVILILIVTFTVVIFGQTQCKKRHIYNLLIWSSLFGHLN